MKNRVLRDSGGNAVADTSVHREPAADQIANHQSPIADGKAAEGKVEGTQGTQGTPEVAPTMAKIHILKSADGKEEHALFRCPGCGTSHVVPIMRTAPVDQGHWLFNGNLEKPTLAPSLRVFAGDGKTTACHLILTDGVINYCADSAHKLRGQAVPLEPFQWPAED